MEIQLHNPIDQDMNYSFEFVEGLMDVSEDLQEEFERNKRTDLASKKV